MNPTVELHRTKEDAIEKFVRQHGTINLDWYVPDLCKTRVGNLIKKRLQLETMEGRILFSSPALSEFFKTSNFELNLKTGEVYTYLDPPENIGIVEYWIEFRMKQTKMYVCTLEEFILIEIWIHCCTSWNLN